MLVEPSNMAASLYRYPTQWADVAGFYSHATDQPVVYRSTYRVSAELSPSGVVLDG